ncbi:MAG: glycoside hydrolase family 113 [Polyangiaceae bacterium]
MKLAAIFSRILLVPLAIVAAPHAPIASATGWRDAGMRGARGITVGPIENGYHPGVGYGSPAYDRTLVEAKAMGAEWIAITPFGRVANLEGRGVDLTFEAPFEENRKNIVRAIEMAHARGLKVMLVPHLWVESGEWRAKIDPGTDAGWDAWAKSYGTFVTTWAKVAEETHAEMFSSGVELRSWVTTSRAPSFSTVLKQIRAVYHGILTYSGNWDDVDHTVILGDLDVIGVNAFFPLADHDGAKIGELMKGGERVRAKVHDLAETWQKPVLFTEIGYTTRENCAIKPWEWPDNMANVKIDEVAQAEAYEALIAPLLDEPDFAGFFVWRVYADPDDVSQEAEWGFSPRGKLAEVVMRDAFAAPWACDGVRRAAFADHVDEPIVVP